MKERGKRGEPQRLVDRAVTWARSRLRSAGRASRRLASRRARALAMTVVLTLSSVLSALSPVAALAVTCPFTEPITIEQMPEDQLEDPAYSWSIDFTGVEAISGFTRTDDIGQYMSAGGPVKEGNSSEYKNTPGWVGLIDGSTKGEFSLRYTGGDYNGIPIDAIVTIEDYNYLERPGAVPGDGWCDTPEFGGSNSHYENFQTGVFVADEWKTVADKETGYQSWNFYTVGLSDITVDVLFVYSGTTTPIDLKGHLTTTDIDVFQKFSYSGAVTQANMSLENDVLQVVDGGTTVDGGANWLDETDPVQYRNGLVEAYFDTTGNKLGTPLRFWFGTSWGSSTTVQSVFFLNTEFLTAPDIEEVPTEIVKSADKTDGVSVGDHVEYTVDYEAHEQGVNCRWGYHYTGLDLVDVLPDEMRYVDGSGRLYDEDGNDITDEAGRVVYEGDNEHPAENTVRFEFDPDYLLTMPMEGEHYRFVFDAELVEYPANGQRTDDDNRLYVRNQSYALVNNQYESWSNDVITKLVEPVFSVDKVADPYEYEVGDTITYTVTYKQTAKNAQSRQTIVSDNLPEYLELIPESVSATGIKDLPAIEVNGNEWSLSFDKFNYGDELVVTYQAVAKQSGNGREIVNNAGIHAINAMDADDPEEVYVNTANVDVTKDVDRYEGYVGASDQDPGFFEYTVHVTNTQEGTVANNVVVTDDSLPEGMKLGRNNDGSLMITSFKEDGQDVKMSWTGDRAEGSLSDIQYRIEDADDVHDQYETVTPSWDLTPEGTGWKLTIDHLDYGTDLEIVYRAYPEDSVSGWEIENEVDATADNSLPDEDTAVVWVNQPHFTIDKEASNDHFQVNDDILYHVKVVNSTPGTLGRNVVISDLAHTGGVELDRGSIRVYDSRGEDITDSCTITYKHNPYGAETFIVETHRDLVAGTTDELADLYAQMSACTTEAEFDEVLAQIRQVIADGGGASHDLQTALIEGRPTWSDGKVTWEGGSNPLGVDPDSPRAGSLSCETEITVEYRVKINDDALAGDTVDNTALVVSDEPNTATTDDEVVDVKGAKLVVEKTSDKDVYQVGETGHYTIVATQTREDNVAENVVISDLMDADDVASIVYGSVKATGPDGQAVEAEPEYVSADNGKIVGFTLNTGTSLADEESITVTYDVTFEKAGASLHNVAQASADRTIGGTDDNTVTVVDPLAAVTLTKDVDSDVVRVGEWATYTLTATVADNPAKNVVISDKSLPEGMPVDLRNIELEINGKDVADFQLDVEGNGFAAHLGDLQPNDVAKITYRAQVRDEALMGTSVVNTAYLTADTLAEPLRDDASVTVPNDEPAVTLTKDVDKSKIHVGDTVTYTVEATVPDDAAAENVVIADKSLPDAMHIDMASIRAWLNGREITPVNADISGNTFSIAFGDLRAGETVKITYNATAQSDELMGKDVVNVATLTSDSIDEPLEATATVRVVEEGETILNKSASANKVAAGDRVTYTVTATAGKDLSDAVITDSGLPEGFAIDEGTIAVKVNGQKVDAKAKTKGTGFEIELGDLTAGDVVEVTYVATVSEDMGATSAKNTAELTSPDLPDPVNDTEIVEVPEQPAPETTIDKAADAGKVAVGDKVTYTVTATAGKDLASAVITDSGLPEGVDIDEGTIAVKVNGQKVDAKAETKGTGFEIELGDLKAGDVVEVSYKATVSEGLEGSKVDNTAELTSPDLPDPVKDTETVEVPDTGTSLTKKSDKTSAKVGDTVVYTIKVTADKDLRSAVVTDSGLPEGVDLKKDTFVVMVNGSSVKVSPKFEGTGFEIELGDLKAGDSVEISYAASVTDKSLAGETLTNTAELTSPDLTDPLSASAKVKVVEESAPSPTTPPSNGSTNLPNTGQALSGAFLCALGIAGLALAGTILKRSVRREDNLSDLMG